MTRQMTSEGSQDRYLARKADEEDLDAMVELFNGFHQCKLFRLLYPGVKDASELSSTHRHVLVQWYNSPVRRLEVIVDQATDEVIAFCSWALDDSLDMPLKEKYYRGPGANTEVIDAFLDKIEHYDELLCQFPDFIYIDWIIISEEHRNKGVLSLLLAWGWRWAVQMKRYIILDSIEETTKLWEDRGFVNLTGAKSQWSLNTLEKDENDPNNAAAKDIPFGPDTVGTAETGQTQLQPMIADLEKLGQSLGKSKFEGRNVHGDWGWNDLRSFKLAFHGSVEYRIKPAEPDV
ncbi:hypothetical protein HD553DRAFT_340810 [Filobasidium floriforme]|uniref:uncharacterized protein n=1 Tax=Filobasidium floriforme TaxID=5210 RepID=UPI001E8E35D9|nr:uncharacterized protein HD553DRAFT_340810 [Filobasidium floriforme]KAH8086838.1 hypothetical protein HD553DRAFT_340810 [Filobasidium floriforme]